MGKAKFKYILMVILLFYIVLMYDTKITFLLWGMIVGYPFVTAFILRLSLRNIFVTMQTKKGQLYQGESTYVSVNLSNMSIFPVAYIEFQLGYLNHLKEGLESKKIVTSLMGKSTKTMSFEVSSSYIGNLEFSVTRIRVIDLSHCFRFKKKSNLTESILVFPKVIPIGEHLRLGGLKLSEVEGVTQPKVGDDPTEIFEIRDYRDGDAHHQIHWKLSSKYQKIMVKEYSMPTYYYPRFLLDLTYVQNELNYDLIETFFECFLSFATWHIHENHPFEVAYYNYDQKQLIAHKIDDRDALVDLMFYLFRNLRQVSKKEHNLVLSQGEQQWNNSNFVYFYMGELETAGVELLFKDKDILCVEFNDKIELNGAKKEDNKHKVMVRPECVENDLQYMIEEYLRGGMNYGGA